MMHLRDVSFPRKILQGEGYHLLVKKKPYSSRTSVRMLQEPDQHTREEQYVDHYHADNVDPGLLQIRDDTDI